MKQISRAVALTIMVMTFGLPTLSMAASIDGSNTNTGADSDNTNQSIIDNSANINVSNTSNVTNDFIVKVNTGNNKISNNTTVGSIKTGDIAFDLIAKTNANSGSIIPNVNWPTVTVSGSNNKTGSGSNNQNTNNIDQRYSSTINNYGSVNNHASVDVNTGGNTISNNTTVGDITTGSVTGKIVFGTTVNDGKGQGTIDNPVIPTTTTLNPVKTVLLAAATVKPAPNVAVQTFFPAGGSISILILGILSVIALIVTPRLSKQYVS